MDGYISVPCWVIGCDGKAQSEERDGPITRLIVSIYREAISGEHSGLVGIAAKYECARSDRTTVLGPQTTT